MRSGDKKGSHVGVVLSFVIFLTFLVFLYSILQPAIKMEKDKEYFLDYLENQLIEKISADLTSLSITINEMVTFQPNKDCVKLNDAHDEIGDFIEEGNLKARDDSNVAIQSYYQNHLSLENPNEEKFYKIYGSEKFISLEGDLNGCNSISKEQYSVSSARTEKYVFESSVDELINSYSNDYDALKIELNIPPMHNFGISFTDADGNTKSTNERAVSASIYAKAKTIQYIDDDAAILVGSITIKVW
ncbi:MAG: hypothetical protein ABIA78_02185 [archaeon]